MIRLTAGVGACPTPKILGVAVRSAFQKYDIVVV
jgi:hypothetical protein